MRITRASTRSEIAMSDSRIKHPPQSVAAETRTLAATGFSIRGIAAHFGVSVTVFDRWLDESEELRECMNSGREDERLSLHNALYRKAMNGDGPAAMFLLKARHGYREGDQSEQGNKVSITFNLPGAMTADQYKTLEGIAKPKRVSNGD